MGWDGMGGSVWERGEVFQPVRWPATVRPGLGGGDTDRTPPGCRARESSRVSAEDPSSMD